MMVEPCDISWDFCCKVMHVTPTFMSLAKACHVAKLGISGIGEHMFSWMGTKQYVVTERDRGKQQIFEHIVTV